MNRDPFVPKYCWDISNDAVGVVCVNCSVWRKKWVEESGTVGRAGMSGVYWIVNVFKLHQFQWQQNFFLVLDPVEMNPLIRKTRAVGQSLMSSAILSLVARSSAFDLVFSMPITEEVSLCICLCKKVTGVISNVKAECVIPMSCVGTWCPLKQSQAVAYFHTKIIHLKIQLAISCSHSSCINFKSEWQLQYVKRLAPLPYQFCTKLYFSIYYWGTGV